METGPDLMYLLQKLQNCPSEFLGLPYLESSPKSYQGEIYVGAVINDLLFELGENMNPKKVNEIFKFEYSEENKNYLQLILISSYILYDPWFAISKKFGKKVYDLLTGKLLGLASVVKAEQFVMDSERREELIRFCLHELNLKPLGETDAQAADRLTSINSIERQRVIKESLAAQKRAQAIREAIAKKEAEEAASKWNRE